MLRKVLPALLVAGLVGVTPAAWAGTPTTNGPRSVSLDKHGSSPSHSLDPGAKPGHKPSEKPKQGKPDKPGHPPKTKPGKGTEAKPSHSPTVVSQPPAALPGQPSHSSQAQGTRTPPVVIKRTSAVVEPWPRSVAAPASRVPAVRVGATSTGHNLSLAGGSVLLTGTDDLLGVDGLVLAAIAAMIGLTTFLIRTKGNPRGRSRWRIPF
jgi:hypothetical protein